MSQGFGWVMKAEVWSRFWSWILTNLWHDLKTVILVKARNSWVRCAFGNVLHIQHLSPWQRGHGYSRPSQRLVKVLWRTAGREFVLQRKHFADRTCKLFADRTCKLFAGRTCKHFAEGTSKELGLSSFVLSCFVVIVKVDVQFSPTNIRLVWRGSFLLPKGIDTLTDTSRYEVYTWGSSFISSKISSSSSSSRTTFSKTNREIQPTQLWVYPN